MAPNDDVEPLRARLQQESRNLMLVGHLPHLSRLTARLLGLDATKEVVRFQMGSVVRLDRDEPRQWVVRWMREFGSARVPIEGSRATEALAEALRGTVSGTLTQAPLVCNP